jgi:hypothetical protein
MMTNVTANAANLAHMRARRVNAACGPMHAGTMTVRNCRAVMLAARYPAGLEVIMGKASHAGLARVNH